MYLQAGTTRRCQHKEGVRTASAVGRVARCASPTRRITSVCLNLATSLGPRLAIGLLYTYTYLRRHRSSGERAIMHKGAQGWRRPCTLYGGVTCSG